MELRDAEHSRGGKSAAVGSDPADTGVISNTPMKLQIRAIFQSNITMYGNYVEERNRKTVARVRASEPVQMPELRDHSRAIGLVAKFNAAHRRRCAERRAFYEKFVRRSIPSPPELKPGTSAAELSEEWMSDLIALFPSAPVSQRSSFQRRRSSMAPSVQQSSFFGRRFSISPSSPRTSRRFSTMRLRSSIREITEEDIATQAKAEQRMVENNFQLWKTHTLIHRFMARHMELDRVRRKDILCRVLIKGVRSLRYAISVRIRHKREHVRLLLDFLFLVTTNRLRIAFVQNGRRAMKVFLHLRCYVNVRRVRIALLMSMWRERFTALMDHYDRGKKNAQMEQDRIVRAIQRKPGRPRAQERFALVGIKFVDAYELIGRACRKLVHRMSMPLKVRYRKLVGEMGRSRLGQVAALVALRKRTYQRMIKFNELNVHSREEDASLALAVCVIKDYEASRDEVLEQQLNLSDSTAGTRSFFGFFSDARLGLPWRQVMGEMAEQDFKALMLHSAAEAKAALSV